MKKGALNLLIGGPAGAGIEKSGKTTAISFLRGGYFVYGNVEHMSQIRGGNNFLRLRIDEKPHASHVEEIDIMIALDSETVEEHISEMVDGGAVIFDSDDLELDHIETGKAVMIGIPLKKMAAEKLGNAIMANIISLGLVCGLVDFDVSVIKKVLAKIFKKKGAEIIKLNEKAADMGFELAGKWANDFHVEMPAIEHKGNMFLDGNDSFALGCLKAGCKYVGEYPMTPSSGILHFMAKWAKKYGVVVKHTEDEIAACNSVIGAGFAGVRAMAATSGGGLALMSEGIGLAGMNEVPCVIANVMRPGPATGLPTRTEQGDLRQVIHAGQGDPVKIVILPGSVEDCFYMGFEAFNLAEKYQLPVIVCFDKHLGEGYFTVPPFDDSGLKVDRGKLVTENPGEDYKRYLRTEDGVSPRTVPGVKGGIHRATSDEHNEYGDIVEDAENRLLMVEKRMQKIADAAADCPKPELIGNEGAEVTFVTWGSCVGICKEAAEIHGNANVLQIKTAYPFHTKEVKEILESIKKPIPVEHNFTGQLAGLIAEHTGIILEDKILRYDGRPLTAQNILYKLKNGWTK